jgi:hypothetical protein
MATDEKVPRTAAVKARPQTLSTTLDDLHDGGLPGHFGTTGLSPLRSGFADREDGKRCQSCRIHAFGYARRIVLSAMTGEMNSEGLFFDVVGLQQHLAENARLPVGATPDQSRSVRLFCFAGPMSVVVKQFCAQVEGLCSPRDIPNPPMTDGLHLWAAATQRMIRNQFAGWSLKTIRQELDAVAIKLADPQP